jgi:DNA polymerase III subunit beta
MFLQLPRDVLLDGLSKLVPITEKRTTLPILSHILVETRSDELILTATDLEVGLRMYYSINTTDETSVAIPARKFFEIVRELPTGLVEIQSMDDLKLKISAGLSVLTLSSMDPQDYPVVGSFEHVEMIPIQAATLYRMIDKTIFAASTDDSRFNLNGIFIEQQNELTALVATDGHRLAYIQDNIGMNIEKSLLVPKKGLHELGRILDGIKGEVQTGIDDKNLYVRTKEFIMTIRLVDGDYPDYRKVIPANQTGLLRINSKSLIQTLRRASIFTTDRSKGVNIDVSSDSVVASVHHPELGSCVEKLEGKYEGQAFEAIINVFYFMDSINAIDTEELSIEYFKEGGPIIVKPVPEANYFNLIMPMRR